MWLFKMRTYPQKPNRHLHVRYIPVCNHPIPNNNVTKSCFNWTAMPMLTLKPKQRRADNDCIVGNLGGTVCVSLTVTFDSTLGWTVASSIHRKNDIAVRYPSTVTKTMLLCLQVSALLVKVAGTGSRLNATPAKVAMANWNITKDPWQRSKQESSQLHVFSTCVAGRFFLWRVSQQLLS